MGSERQAVIVIHGIGEQKPMSTLRGFVSTLVGQFGSGSTSENRKFYSKPDILSNSLELRRLTTPGSKENIKTDYFEYYWAHRIRDTTLNQVLFWIGGLLFRFPWSLPKRIRFVHVLLWVAVLGLGYLLWKGGGLDFSMEAIPRWVATLLTAAYGVATYVLTSYVGDAVRYTSPAPANISKRQKIRKNGLKLLRALHKSGKYSRIVIVGHSLGSIIGYDLIRYFWIECNEKYQGTDLGTVKLFESKFAPANRDKFKIEEYTDWQTRLLKDQQGDQNPWLISDFVTLGSPLTYSSFLLAKDTGELNERIGERELPSSPPFYETLHGKRTLTFKPDYPLGREVLHHSCPFACTKWTNLYYSNDFVGGGVGECYGPGISEHRIEIKGNRFIKAIPFLSHTHYWGDSEKDNKLCEASVSYLKEIILRPPTADVKGGEGPDVESVVE